MIKKFVGTRQPKTPEREINPVKVTPVPQEGPKRERNKPS
jgi:hypothetical protein